MGFPADWMRSQAEFLRSEFGDDNPDAETLERGAQSFDDLRAELAEARAELENCCDDCGARVSNYRSGCPNCGAPQCCQQCCTIATLNKKLDEAMSCIQEADAVSRGFDWQHRYADIIEAAREEKG